MIRKWLLLLTLVITNLAAAYAEDGVVAKVNNVAIGSADLESALNSLLPRSTYHGTVSGKKLDELRRKALDALVVQELQYQDALAKAMKAEKKLVDERMSLIRKRFSTKKEYKQALKVAGMTETEVRKRAERAVLIEANIRKSVTEPSRMSEDALREYYDRNTGKFREPEGVRMRIISAKEEKPIREALAEIKSGKDFGDVAAEKSEDRYRVKGGDLGFVHRGRVLPELEEAAFAMKPGEFEGPISADGQWFLVKVEDRRPERQMSFEESREKLRAEMEASRAAEQREKWLEELRAKAKIEVLWKPAVAEQGTEK